MNDEAGTSAIRLTDRDEAPWNITNLSLRTRLAVTGLFLFAAALVLPWEIWVSARCVNDQCPRAVRELLEMAERFGNGYGVVIILVASWLLDPGNRRKLPRIGAAALCGGLAADLLKMVIARWRPRDFNFRIHDAVSDTFVSWFPLWHGSTQVHSFPSAHTATAVALAIALVAAYPRGRALFVTLAVLVAMQRVEEGAHFASDVLCGSAAGWLVGTWLVRPGAWDGFFARIEARGWGTLAVGKNREPESRVSRAA